MFESSQGRHKKAPAFCRCLVFIYGCFLTVIPRFFNIFLTLFRQFKSELFFLRNRQYLFLTFYQHEHRSLKQWMRYRDLTILEPEQQKIRYSKDWMLRCVVSHVIGFVVNYFLKLRSEMFLSDNSEKYYFYFCSCHKR